MGGSEPPYLYTPQRTVYPFSNFNPKAVTEAEYKKVEDEQKSRPKSEGPLINFNAHPDSYMIVGTKDVKYKTMPARTKKEVKIVRWVQFAHKLMNEVAALGMLVCVICIKNVQLSLVWIMRLAPAADILITLYAIYHLIRPAKARTAASSASYHIFALLMDIGLIPFYVFIAMFADTNYNANPDSKERWTSFFTASGATTTLLFATFMGAAALAGLHLICAIFDLWLIVLFRKISKLPPDMNPLEDNLTGRSSTTSKHKYKDSNATLVGSTTEKKSMYLSGSTISVDQYSRLSTAIKDEENSRSVPFQHSRMGSQTTFSPHNPNTARWSREQFEDVNLYNQHPSARNSRADLSGQRPSPSKRSSFVENMDAPPPPPRSIDRLNSRRPISYPDNRSNTNLSNPSRYSSPALPNAAPTNALVKSQQKQGLLNDNWISVEDDFDPHVDSPSRQPKIPDVYTERRDSFEVQPLRMNPPTPPPKTRYEYPDPGDDQPLRAHINRAALSPRNDNGNGNLGVQRADTTASSVYSESSPSLKTSKAAGGTPKGKYYGNLSAATIGVRGMKSNDTIKSNGTVSAATMDSTGMMALGEYGFSAPSPPPLPKKMRTPRGQRETGGRVVSRTGVDIADAQAPYPGAMRERRDVSGKVAEEGRGDRGWYDRRQY